MKRNLGRMLAAAGVVVMTTIGVAAAAPGERCGSAGGPPWAAMRGDINGFAEKRLATLHAGLKLNPQQDAAWQEFRGALLTQAEQAQNRMRAWRQAEPPRTAIDRIEFARRGADERRAALDAVAGATRQFYAALDDGQKSFFDEHFRLMPGGDRHGRHRHGAG